MPNRVLAIPPPALKPQAMLTLRTPPHWTAIIFFFALACLHLSIAIPAFLKHRWEGYMSAGLAICFLCACVVVHRSRTLITFDGRRRAIRIRHGSARINFQRSIGFDDVHAVRLTLAPSDRPATRIEVLCDNEDIECPPTSEPREQALYLAMLMDVQLIKVWADCDADSHTHSPRI